MINEKDYEKRTKILEKNLARIRAANDLRENSIAIIDCKDIQVVVNITEQDFNNQTDEVRKELIESLMMTIITLADYDDFRGTANAHRTTDDTKKGWE